MFIVYLNFIFGLHLFVCHRKYTEWEDNEALFTKQNNAAVSNYAIVVF